MIIVMRRRRGGKVGSTTIKRYTGVDVIMIIVMMIMR